MPSAKKKRLSGRGSSTPGISKGENCRKSPLKTRLAKDTRFYKTDPPGYAEVSDIVNKLNDRKSNTKKEEDVKS